MTKRFIHRVSGYHRHPLTAAIASGLIGCLLAPSAVWAQQDCVELEGTPPGLYTTTDEGQVYVIKDGQIIELGPGDSGFASEDKLVCIKAPPAILEWPCATDAANSRKFATYRLDEITSDNPAQEIVRRFFEVPEVIEPIPNFVDGEYHTTLSYEDIIQFSSPAYWYHPNDAVDFMQEKRPKTLQISLYVGTNQVVIDNYAVDEMRELYGGQDIPVVFVFNDSNEVPVSYFGDNVSLQELHKAFIERSIKVAEVPMWPLGDYTLAPTADEFELLFDLPDLEDIDPLRREALAAGLETYGFTKKPVFVTMLEGSDRLYIDDPERVRVALSLGISRLPTVINFVEQDVHLRRCGPGTPVGAANASVSGSTTPIGGPLVPPGGLAPPPPPDPAASDS
ncbi:hypothetical protein [Elongatibacter sediminis]|uniref:Thioredoxin domain-containing protein n=1 Tax=Elongatibacter sediminis TaxID=3119006 RepID=A0AAW9R5K7_9GAMM